MRELPNPTFALSPVSMPGGHFTDLIPAPLMRFLRLANRSAVVCWCRGPATATKFGKRNA